MAYKHPSHQQQQHPQMQMQTDTNNVGDMRTDLERVLRSYEWVRKLEPEMTSTDSPETKNLDRDYLPIIQTLTEIGWNHDETYKRVEHFVNKCLESFGPTPCSGGGAMGGHGKMRRGPRDMMMGRGHYGGHEFMDDMGGYSGYDQGPWQCFYCGLPVGSQGFEQQDCKSNKDGHAAVPSNIVWDHNQSVSEGSRLKTEDNKLNSQINDLEGRLKAEMGVKEGDEDVRINLKMDASSISAKYSQICVRERDDAKKEIIASKQDKDENKTLQNLCNIIMISGSVTEKVVVGFRQNIEEMILNPSMDKAWTREELEKSKKKKWTPEHDRALNELLRSVSSQVNIESLMNEVLQEARLPYKGNAFYTFVKETVLIAWIMAMQSPPMKFYLPQKSGDKLRDAFEEYEGRGPMDPSKFKDVLYVCPALREGVSPLSRGKVKVIAK